MNIKELNDDIRYRPQRFVGNGGIEHLSIFILGFCYYSIKMGIQSEIDRRWQFEFHNYARKEIEKRYDIKFDLNVGYPYYIESLPLSKKEKFDLFFELCDKYFEEQEEDS